MLQTDGSRRHKPCAARAADDASLLTNSATGPASNWNPCRRDVRCITVEYRMTCCRSLRSSAAAVCVLIATALSECNSQTPAASPAGSAGAAPASAAAPAPEGTRPSPITSLPRVVILGDSLTAGLGLTPDEAYPSLLQRRLNKE